ncbi:MAG: hypothetical protein ACFCUQ_18240 [Kiloniellales bacterium]
MVLAAGAGPADAHAFGERYDLPLPLGLYLGGAAATVVVSFVLIGLFVRDVAWSRRYPRYNLLAHPLGRLAAHPAVVTVLKLASVLLFLLVLAAGSLGNPDPFRNIAPVLVWIIFWVGLAYVSAFIGDLWTVINPWRSLFAWAEALWRRLRPGRALAFGLPYPTSLGVWPSVALLLAFAWSELISPRPAAPAYLAWMALVYSLWTWTGMVLFGRERWLRHGEVFSVVFGLLARFAPTEVRTARPEVCAACGLGCRDRDGACVNCTTCWSRVPAAEREWSIRPFAVGLLRDEPVSASMVALVLLYLSTVLFDGLLVTPAWRQLEALIVPLVPAAGDLSRMAVRTSGLVGLWLVCLGVYLATCRAMGALVEGRPATGAIARRFAFTLVPIAIGYHLAHYLTYLLIQGQHAIPLASDPFGQGWDLLGTAGYRVDLTVVGARFAWYAAVVAIVTGHVVAVCLAHVQAVATFGARRPALRSQYPLTALMVAFTVASLSVMAEPLVQRTPTAAAEVAPTASAEAVVVPADALLPELGSGRLVPVGANRTVATKLTYGAMASPFHDGTAMTAADLLYPFSVAFRWAARESADDERYDPVIERATALLRRGLAGLELLGVDAASKTIRFGDLTYAREVLVVAAYLDLPAGDVEAAAAVAPPWSPLPWHVIALLEEAVVRGWAAFSQDEAVRLGVEWLDPVRSEPLKAHLLSLVEAFEREGYLPDPLAGMVTPAEARSRWQALLAFHARHGHFLVTNGPYVVTSWSDDATVLEVVRDPNYPLGVGSYDSYAIPRRAYVSQVDSGADGIVLSVEVETVETSMRSYRIVRRPLKEASASFGSRSIPECRYVVIGEDGRVALAGRGRAQDDGTFSLDLRDKLASGRYTVLAALYLNGNTVNAEIRRIPYELP